MIQDANSEEVGPERDCTEEKYLIAILIVSPLEFRTNCKGGKNYVLMREYITTYT